MIDLNLNTESFKRFFEIDQDSYDRLDSKDITLKIIDKTNDESKNIESLNFNISFLESVLNKKYESELDNKKISITETTLKDNEQILAFISNVSKPNERDFFEFKNEFTYTTNLRFKKFIYSSYNSGTLELYFFNPLGNTIKIQIPVGANSFEKRDGTCDIFINEKNIKTQITNNGSSYYDIKEYDSFLITNDKKVFFIKELHKQILNKYICEINKNINSNKESLSKLDNLLNNADEKYNYEQLSEIIEEIVKNSFCKIKSIKINYDENNSEEIEIINEFKKYESKDSFEENNISLKNTYIYTYQDFIFQSLFNFFSSQIERYINFCKREENISKDFKSFRKIFKSFFKGDSSWRLVSNLNPIIYLDSKRKVVKSSLFEYIFPKVGVIDDYELLFCPITTSQNAQQVANNYSIRIDKSNEDVFAFNSNLFEKESNKNDIALSCTSSLIPFINHNDGIRVIMGTSAIKQAYPFPNAEIPLCQTGYEKQVLEQSQFIKGMDGKINSDFHFYWHSKKINIQKTAKKGRKKKTDAEINENINDYSFIQEYYNNELKYGYNALVALLPYNGFSYEDGLVISERFAKECSYEPIEIKLVHFLPEKYLLDINIFDEEVEIQKDEPLIKMNELITPKNWQEKMPKADRKCKRIWVNIQKSQDLRDPCINLKIAIKYLDENDKPEKVSLKLGDKLSNRYGNKGVISKIIPDSQMPYIKIGEKFYIPDILLNPISAIRRTNFGQMYEMTTNFVRNRDKVIMNRWLKDVSNSKLNEDDNINTIVNNFDTKVTFSDNKFSLKIVDQEIDLEDTKYEMYIPKENLDIKQLEPTKEKVNIGISYFMILDKFSKDQIISRGTSVPDKKLPTIKHSSQANRGRLLNGGLRFGEMEMWCLGAMGCDNLIKYITEDSSVQFSKFPNAFITTLMNLTALGKILNIRFPLNRDGNLFYSEPIPAWKLCSEGEYFKLFYDDLSGFDKTKPVKIVSGENWLKKEDDIYQFKIPDEVKKYFLKYKFISKFDLEELKQKKKSSIRIYDEYLKNKINNLIDSFSFEDIFSYQNKLEEIIKTNKDDLEEIVKYISIESYKSKDMEISYNQFPKSFSYIEIVVEKEDQTKQHYDLVIMPEKFISGLLKDTLDPDNASIVEIYRELIKLYNELIFENDKKQSRQEAKSFIQNIRYNMIFNAPKDNSINIYQNIFSEFEGLYNLVFSKLTDKEKIEKIDLTLNSKPFELFLIDENNETYKEIFESDDYLKLLKFFFYNIMRFENSIESKLKVLNKDREPIILSHDNELSQIWIYYHKKLIEKIEDKISGKLGFIQRDVFGKRCDYSGRAVIVPEPNLELDYLILPEKFKEDWNIADGKEIWVLFNRAPSLLPTNVQAFKVKEWIKDENVIKMNPLICPSFGADFDGDAMQVFYIKEPDQEMLKELESITISKNIESLLFKDKLNIASNFEIQQGYQISLGKNSGEKVQKYFSENKRYILNNSRKYFNLSTEQGISISLYEILKINNKMDDLNNLIEKIQQEFKMQEFILFLENLKSNSNYKEGDIEKFFNQNYMYDSDKKKLSKELFNLCLENLEKEHLEKEVKSKIREILFYKQIKEEPDLTDIKIIFRDNEVSKLIGHLDKSNSRNLITGINSYEDFIKESKISLDSHFNKSMEVPQSGYISKKLITLLEPVPVKSKENVSTSDTRKVRKSVLTAMAIGEKMVQANLGKKYTINQGKKNKENLIPEDLKNDLKEIISDTYSFYYKNNTTDTEIKTMKFLKENHDKQVLDKLNKIGLFVEMTSFGKKGLLQAVDSFISKFNYENLEKKILYKIKKLDENKPTNYQYLYDQNKDSIKEIFIKFLEDENYNYEQEILSKISLLSKIIIPIFKKFFLLEINISDRKEFLKQKISGFIFEIERKEVK